MRHRERAANLGLVAADRPATIRLGLGHRGCSQERPCESWSRSSARRRGVTTSEFELPRILKAEDFARLLGIRPEAVRSRALRGQLPRPFESGRALAWTREAVLSRVRHRGRPAGRTMKIKTRPYNNHSSRFQVATSMSRSSKVMMFEPAAKKAGGTSGGREREDGVEAPCSQAARSRSGVKAWPGGNHRCPGLHLGAVGASARAEDTPRPSRLGSPPSRWNSDFRNVYCDSRRRETSRIASERFGAVGFEGPPITRRQLRRARVFALAARRGVAAFRPRWRETDDFRWFAGLRSRGANVANEATRPR